MSRRLYTMIALPLLMFAACSSDDDGAPTVPVDNVLHVSYILPSTAPIGETVRIHGSQFGTDVSAIKLTIGSLIPEITSITDTDIEFIVPEALPILPTQMKISKNGGAERTIQFTVDDPLIRSWLSEGTDIAPYLFEAPLLRRSITANFSKDGSYTIQQTDSAGFSNMSTGTWTTEEGKDGTASAALRKVTLQQGSPDNTKFEGIYHVTVAGGGPQMKLEVIEVQPPRPGVTPPTIDGGFGSSGGSSGGRYTQQYYRK